MDLTVVIPSVGLGAMLRTCVATLRHSLAAQPGIEASVVIVDNGTQPPYASGAIGEDVSILRFDVPHSYARACNAGARHRPAARYLMLNNDVFITPESLHEMLGLLAAHPAAIVGARMVLADDTIQHCGVRFDDGPRGPFHIHHGRPTSVVPRMPERFQAVTGAAMLIPAPLFDRLDGFDEAFPFGYEDVDLCLRAGQLGAAVLCAQSHDSLHLESMSSRRPDRHAASRKVFFERWRGRYTVDGDRSQ